MDLFFDKKTQYEISEISVISMSISEYICYKRHWE
jgi:hypothetical protein